MDLTEFASIIITDDKHLHVQDPARPSVPVTYVNGRRVDGGPGRTICGAVPFCRTNEQGARQLYPNHTPCPACE